MVRAWFIALHSIHSVAVITLHRVTVRVLALHRVTVIALHRVTVRVLAMVPEFHSIAF